MSRASFAGHGQHAQVWLGDNESSVRSMQNSIHQVIDMSTFGIPFTGADVCGFGGDASDSLCARWAQLGAFYPFFRNHDAIEQEPQEFYRFTNYEEGIKTAIHQ